MENQYIYLYGITFSNEVKEKVVPLFNGIDEHQRFLIPFQDITAVVCFVSPLEFSQEHIDVKIKDPKWLEEKAFHHHECISLIDKELTILPFPFCTIYQNKENLTKMLSEHYRELFTKLKHIYQKKEWNLKVFYDSDLLKTYVMENNRAVLDLQKEIEHMPKGKQFIMRKKLQNVIQDEVEREQNKQLSEFSEDLRRYSVDYLIRKNWGKEITQRNDDMLLNCDFLVENKNIKNFLTCLRDYEQDFSQHGWSIQVTGPWPPYHFSKMVKEV